MNKPSASSILLQSLVHHVALPPQLPGRPDKIEQIEHALTSRLLDASRALRDLTNDDFSRQWDAVRNILQTRKAVNAGGKLNRTSLLAEFRELQRKGLLILHVAEQNAGLLIRRHHDAQGDNVIFEAFEASPRSEDVLASENALQWDSPGCAVAVSYSTFSDTSFQNNLAAFLEQASTESIKRFAARTQKAGSFAYESRDTVDPALITQMLMTLLEANGHRIFPSLLRKRVRDYVCWTDGAEKPWRRCAYWLVLRVGLERHLRVLHGGEVGRVHYKFLLCLFLARLIEDALDHLDPHILAFLRTKPSRRLVKLEVDKDRASPQIRSIYEAMFTTLGPLFRKTLKRTTEHIEAIWNGFKRSMRRPVYPLPRHADRQHLILTLPKSGPYLQQVLSWNLQMDSGAVSVAPYQLARGFDVSLATTTQFKAFAHRYFSLSHLEIEIEESRLAPRTSTTDHEKRCVKLAGEIDSYLSATANAYENNPEQKSIMLLTVMELWMSMDQCATELFHLLMDYNPGIPPEILDVLQLPYLTEMYRLQGIQQYLRSRLTKCNFTCRTIFDDPAEGCFAARYYDEAKDSYRLQELHRSIEAVAEFTRKGKEEEWQRMHAEFESLEKQAIETTCLSTTDGFRVLHDDRCTKCFLQRKARRMKIRVHEHPLPVKPVHAKAVVFEIACPKAFAAYRNTTWRILATLSRSNQTKGLEPRLVLSDYSELQAFMTSPSGGVSLASTTKSFLDTHYTGVRFPVSLDHVCLPNGLRWGYFDPLTQTWPSRLSQKPTFAHHLQMSVTENSLFSSLQLSPDLAIGSDGPSSYEIIASQTRCPSGLNIHEFMAYQTLFSGKNRRWLSLLTELGSSNLNFSTEAITSLVTQLALQAGPAHEFSPLRAAHGVLRDDLFCERLMEQIRQRLDGISSNWREINCMDMLLTLILRLSSVASDPTVRKALELLEQARTVTFKWIRQLRMEIHRSTDAIISRKCSRYAVWAALLCKRTFTVYAEAPDAGFVDSLHPGALSCFIECSITLQNNLVTDPAVLPSSLKNALVRDLKMTYRLRFFLRQSIEDSPDSFKSAINGIWPQPEGDASRAYSAPTFLETPEWWVESTIQATKQANQQTIHFHLLEGHLLVQGQPLGKLPANHRESVVLGQLFGNQSLLTYPSGLRGMTYTLAFTMEGHQIHLGFRNGGLIVQACHRDTILELIPRHVFGDRLSFDLPASLIENCVHWLDLRTGILEVRQQPNIWKFKPSNWLLDFAARMARRRRSVLVDPHSPLFQRVARIFDGFEHRDRLTVFQPETTGLSIELRRLELTFFVNSKKLLQCRQLRSEIDPNQDAGTFYGLRSAVVIRDVLNPRQRSIIVPMGPAKYQQWGAHVVVNVDNNGSYGRFTINDVLGRLDCPPEPKLLYVMALFHAYTSFPVPDPLTGRTGTEEALHCLRSSKCQPWAPINPVLSPVLMSLAKLTPKREYYPRDAKSMQQVFWDPHCTTTIQHEEFRPIVEAIQDKSNTLSAFFPDAIELPSLEAAGDRHLSRRSYLRRLDYQRPSSDSTGQLELSDLPYEARDRPKASKQSSNVLECVTLLRNWSGELLTTVRLAEILQNWPMIGGYDRDFDKFLLSDRLDVQFALEWGALANFCRTSGPKDVCQLMFLFAVMSFRNDVEMETVRTSIAFSILEDFKALSPPKWPSYEHFRLDHIPSVSSLVQLIKPCCAPYPGDDRSSLGVSLGTKLRRKLEEAELAHERQTETDCKAFAEFLLGQWPCPVPTAEGFNGSLLINISQAMEIVRPEWLRLFKNMELSCHIRQVQHVLDRHRTDREIELPKLRMVEQEVFPSRCRGGEFPMLSQDLLRRTAPVAPKDSLPAIPNGDTKHFIDPSHNALPNKGKENIPGSLQYPIKAKHMMSSVSREMHELQTIIDGVTKPQSIVQQQYGRDLMQSLDALKMLKSKPKQGNNPINPAKLSADILQARQTVNELSDQLCMAFKANDSRAPWLEEGGLWPCVTPVTLLEQLRSTSDLTFGGGMKERLVAYGVSISILQRLLRIEDFHLKGDKQRLLEEQENQGHSNWQPLKYPDWLLLEIDANILVRPDQVDVALATISPASGSNSVLQMNMGQGKTSCIMPMVAAVLADSKKLLRVVVPKALLLQTAQLLQARLGGLLGRTVRHIPFSRKTPTNSKTIKAFYTIHKEIRASSGMTVALPEHILSFMLGGLQRLSDARLPEATQMVKVQSWTRKVCRDVLDECDFTLAVRTQLIYPSGSQTTVDGHPHRWETAEALLQLVEGHLWNLQQDFPQSIEVVPRPQGGFPMVFFLRKDVEDALITRLVEDLIRGQTSIIPARECSQSDRLAVKHFISDAIVRPAVAERIQQIFLDKPVVRQTIYLVRGLLVHRILLLTLKKRWNVQYGLHPTRDPVAVPFHAKGVPSEQAEWGHPDVAIFFTCLAFYYGGLTPAQLRQNLEHVVKSDDPSGEYDRWAHSSTTLPGSLREWSAINVDDETQLMDIWQHLRYKVVVIDYFLNHFVFPRHAKQFRIKLQASGWDIPLFNPGNQTLTEQKNVGKYLQPLTTGFSGTNDSRTMLPLTIKQEDLGGLSHTNAEVLTYLLQSRNRRYVLAADERGRRLSELDLLHMLSRMKIRMLIDAGAQVLETDNYNLAKAWLEVDNEAPAAVYFDVTNKPCVVYRQGSPIPLVASPFADNPSECLVYLDEAHTRGTDLKMPADARGALTLGLGQTKDHTVQAAMRLRQLGTSQSVVFFAPPEVHQSILDVRKKRSGDLIDSHDVVCWLLEQTCSGIEQMQPLYYSHGADFCRRTQAALDNPDFLDDADQRETYLSVLRQTEHQTLEQLYKPRTKSKYVAASGPFSPEIAAFMKELNIRRKAFKDLGNAVHGSTLEEVEQERETQNEAETVREVQKPVHYTPLSFPGLHRDIVSFVETGRLAAGAVGYEHAFVALRRTGLGLKYGINGEFTASKFFVSKEFMRTVSMPLDRPNDNFLRPVNWILWSIITEAALIIIPEEAELLLPLIRDAKDSPTHLLTYAAPVTRKMCHFNKLNYYAVPALPTGWTPPKWLIIELGIFAGCLYFDFDKYGNLCKFLGFREDGARLTETSDDVVPSAELHEVDGAADGADVAEMDGGSGQGLSFTAKPLTFLQEWLVVRRKGQEFTHTPMGYVCQGKLLTANHPFFARVENIDGTKTTAAVTRDSEEKQETVGVGAGGDAPSDNEYDEYDGYLNEGEYEDGMLDEGERSSGDDFTDAVTNFDEEEHT